MEESLGSMNNSEAQKDNCDSNKESFDLNGFIRLKFNLGEQDLKTYSPLVLAFIGDGVYELVIRTVIVDKGNAPVNKLHRKVSSLVRAEAQASVLHSIEPILSEEEKAVFKRGRNAKSYTSAKNASIADYRVATGLEALIGYLYMSGEFDRIMELIKDALCKMNII